MQPPGVKCGKISEVTLGTPDVKSGPIRYQKELQLQLMCCTPFRLLSQDFGGQRIGERIGVCSWSRTYSIFKLRYLHASGKPRIFLKALTALIDLKHILRKISEIRSLFLLKISR